jgi:hypothetical protein
VLIWVSLVFDLFMSSATFVNAIYSLGQTLLSCQEQFVGPIYSSLCVRNWSSVALIVIHATSHTVVTSSNTAIKKHSNFKKEKLLQFLFANH